MNTLDNILIPKLWEAARAAHEVNRAYCHSIGDTSQLPWHEAPDWQKRSAYQGVLMIINGSVKSPGDSHVSWLETKRKDGWVYGPVKDPEQKLHPCMVPFDQLPFEQQVKDHLFLATVRSVLMIVENDPYERSQESAVAEPAPGDTTDAAAD